MDLIPTWVQRLWDAWDLRVLVLLSFTLQIILSIFGNRRKYISSVWISVLVWSAYLMADWVATVALGKLSDVQGDREKSNVLWAIWAPLLLLHLGGPDTISAYSLEDNQLWLRHLLGLVVQLFVAIYVILLSWKNSWFSFMSIPALVAGIIKYGERTWVLKSVRDVNYLHRIPLGDLKDKYSAEGHDYVRVLVVAHVHLNDFMNYLEHEGTAMDVRDHWGTNMEANILRDSVEVKMGLMYDLLYTKATVIYNSKGFTMRCISFGCTVSVLLGLAIQIVHLKNREEDDEENYWHEIDIAITGVLTVGAVALEIYAAIVIFSSNWMMLWLIKQGKKEWVTWLSQRFPWLFNKKKNWSQMMGQFDLLGYCLKLTEPDRVQSPSTKIIRSVLGRNYEDKWNEYQHKTAYSVTPLVYNAILELCDPHIDSRISDSLARELAIVNMLFDYSHPVWDNFSQLIQRMHFTTEICYHLEREWANAGGEADPSGSDSRLWKKNREVSKTVSDYMMYLLVMHPSLLPDIGSRDTEVYLKYPKNLIRDERDVNAACHHVLSWSTQQSSIVEDLKGKEKPKRWEIIKLLWLRMLRIATIGAGGCGQKDAHLQQLRQGGELLTFIWFINPPYETTQSILENTPN